MGCPGRWCKSAPACNRWSAATSPEQKNLHTGSQNQRLLPPGSKRLRHIAGDWFCVSSAFLLRNTGNSKNGQQGALQAELPRVRVVPFLQGMGAAAAAPCANRDGVNPERQRNVGIRGGALDAGFVPDIFVGSAKSGKQWRIRAQFPTGTAAEQFDSPLENSFRAVARRLQLVSHPRGNGFMQGGFQPRQLVLALRANVHLDVRLERYGIHRSTTLDLPDVESGTRANRDFRIDKTYRTANQSVDRIGHAKIRPTVAAGTGNGSLEPPRGERLGCDMLRAGTIDHHNGLQFLAVILYQLAHAAQIALALFSYVCAKKNRPLRLDARRLQGACDGRQCRNARAIIGDSRRQQAASFVANFHVCTSGKNRVQMGANDNDFVSLSAAQFADDVANLVRMHSEAALAEQLAHCDAARCFLVGGSGNLCQADLLMIDPDKV